MKTRLVEILNIRKSAVATQSQANCSSPFLIIVLFLVISCSKSNDLETIVTYSPIVVNSQIYNPIYNPNNNSPIDTGSHIIYTDLEPDFMSSNNNDVYNLDLDNNGTVDFTFNNLDSWAFWAEPNSNTNGINAFVAVSGPFESYIVPIIKDDVISSKLNSPYFYDGYGCYLIMEFYDIYPPNSAYGWQGKIDHYVGLQLMINDQIHYAWVRFDVTNSKRWIIKDYAYNASPNKPILAGQKD